LDASINANKRKQYMNRARFEQQSSDLITYSLNGPLHKKLSESLQRKLKKKFLWMFVFAVQQTHLKLSLNESC